MTTAKKDDRVEVADPDGKPYKHKKGKVWIVTNVNGNKISAIPDGGTNKEREVFNTSRVIKKNGKKTDAIKIAERQSNVTTKHKPVQESKMADASNKKKANKNKPKKTKAKEEPVRLDLKDLVSDGSELFTKKVEGFDHPEFEVIAHYLIAPDKKTYKCFNTYNGSLGRNSRKSLPRKSYDIKQGKYDKFIDKLTRSTAKGGKGFTKFKG